MTIRLHLLAVVAVAGLALQVGAQGPLDIAAEEIDRSGLSAADLATLNSGTFRWKHMQTERFVLHYNQKMFAVRVARLAEQFYEAIADDLPELRDRVAPSRSHIFIFRDSRDWQTVLAGTLGMQPWASSFVRGNVMYLQEVGASTSDKMDMLAHEMTHLVFNRFLTVRLPLWLNEGLAEYYGEFAYRTVRGMGQSKRSAFPPLRRRMPMEQLLDATTYPERMDDVRLFYATSKTLVGYLLWRLPRPQWDAFFARVLAGENARSALLDTYGWNSIVALDKEFSRFAR